jgi:hypothetical protein
MRSTASIGVAYRPPQGRTRGALVVGEFAIADEQVCADDIAGRREVAAHHPDDRVALPVTGRAPLAPEHPHAAEHEQDAEDVDNPVEEREQLRARRDERAPQDEGAEDAISPTTSGTSRRTTG